MARFTSILKKSSPVLPRPGVDFRSRRSALSLKPLVVVGVCACLRSFRLTTLAFSSFLAASSRTSSRANLYKFCSSTLSPAALATISSPPPPPPVDDEMRTGVASKTPQVIIGVKLSRPGVKLGVVIRE